MSFRSGTSHGAIASGSITFTKTQSRCAVRFAVRFAGSRLDGCGTIHAGYGRKIKRFNKFY